ncbi:MAG: YqhG family protein [Limnochordia bacterium]|jgi:hypothetical protein
MEERIGAFLINYLTYRRLPFRLLAKGALKTAFDEDTALQLGYQGATEVIWAWDPRAQSQFPQAELITTKSQRLAKIIESFGSNNPIAKGYYHQNHLGPTYYHPYFLWLFQLAYHGTSTKEELVPIAVDLVEGQVREDLAQLFLQRGEEWSYPLPHKKRRLSFRRAHGLAYEHIKGSLQQRDGEWAQRAQRELQQRLADLDSYYQELTAENSPLERDYEQHAAEEESRLHPHLQIRAIGGALIYCQQPLNGS